jgi:ATP-binding cassette subfamily B protein
MEALRGHRLMLKHLFKVSRAYLPLGLLNQTATAAVYISNVFFYRYVTNYIVYEKIEFKKIVMFFGFYYFLSSVLSILIYLIDKFEDQNVFNGIREYIQRVINLKMKDIDIAHYDNPVFHDNYRRAAYDAHSRIINSAAFINDLFINLIYVITFTILYSHLDYMFIFAAILIALHNCANAHISNKVNTKKDYLQTLPARKREFVEYLLSSYISVKELKLFNFYELLMDKFHKAKEDFLNIEKREGKKTVAALFASNFVLAAIGGFVSIYTIYKIINGSFTIGDIALISSSVFTLGNSIGNLLSIVPNIKNESIQIGYLEEILNIESVIQENKDGIKLNDSKPVRLSFKNVSFAYPSNPEQTVLNGVTLDIEKGKKLAIVGYNGSGKSTFVNLLLYLYKENAGEILCDGYSYDRYNTESLRGAFSVVFQDFQIFAISIAENILLHEVNSAEDEKTVWDALKFSGLLDKVKSLENGIHSVITKEFDEDGVFLSGGESQKLAIARAYARNSSVLVFDEPSSSLDPLAEHEIFSKLLALGKDKTVIYISHRLSSVVDADEIVLFDNGEIAEKGTHAQLMKLGGKYFEMFNLQAEKYIA